MSSIFSFETTHASVVNLSNRSFQQDKKKTTCPNNQSILRDIFTPFRAIFLLYQVQLDNNYKYFLCGIVPVSSVAGFEDSLLVLVLGDLPTTEGGLDDF